MDSDLNTLADAYLHTTAQLNRGEQVGTEDWRAWEEVLRLVRSDLTHGFEVILLLISKAETDLIVQGLAAGPLEDLLDMHRHKAMDLLEPACEDNLRLQYAVRQVGMPFWHELFERWYALKCKCGFEKVPRDDPAATIAGVVQCMKDFVQGRLEVHTYRDGIIELLSKPLPGLDQRTKQILKAVDWDIEMAEEAELKAKVSILLAQLNSPGDRPSP